MTPGADITTAASRVVIARYQKMVGQLQDAGNTTSDEATATATATAEEERLNGFQTDHADLVRPESTIIAPVGHRAVVFPPGGASSA